MVIIKLKITKTSIYLRITLQVSLITLITLIQVSPALHTKLNPKKITTLITLHTKLRQQRADVLFRQAHLPR